MFHAKRASGVSRSGVQAIASHSTWLTRAGVLKNFMVLRLRHYIWAVDVCAVNHAACLSQYSYFPSRFWSKISAEGFLLALFLLSSYS